MYIMKRQVLFLSMTTFFALNALAQTPYDNFAPEQSVKPIIEMPKMHFKVANTNLNSEIRSIEFDKNTLSLNLLNESDSVLKSITLNPNDKKFTSIDPLTEKYYHISPYAYCMNSPIIYIDPNGMDVYRFDDKTGEMHLFLQTDDDFDQIGRFKYDKKTDTYVLKTNKNGEARTRIDNIEKGILSDGMNFKTNANVWEVGGQEQPTVEGFQNFAIDFSEMIGREVAGFYFSDPEQNDVSYIHMGKYENNRYNKSHSTPSIYSVRPDLYGNIAPHTSWHTHPSTAPLADRLRPSGLTTPGGDMEHKQNHVPQGFHTFIILTKGYPPILY